MSKLGEDYRWGSDTARVTIVEFADFQCPACKHLSDIMKEIKAIFKQQVLIVFKNYPLDNQCNQNIRRSFHPFACKIALMARLSWAIWKILGIP